MWGWSRLRDERVGRVACVFLSLLLLTPLGSRAQEVGSFEVSGGYTFLGSSEIVDGHAAGWVVGGGWNAAQWLALAVDLGRNTQQQDVGLLKVDASFVSVSAGPRFVIPLGKVRPFGQVLVGSTDVELHVRSELPPTSVGNAFERSLSWQVGGGVDVAVERGFALRLVFDYRRVSTSDPFTQKRVLTAVVYSFP